MAVVTSAAFVIAEDTEGDVEDVCAEIASLKAKALDLFAQTEKIDLTRVAQRVAKEQPSWSAEKLAEAVVEYRRWLVLCAVTADTAFKLGMCSTDVDEIWHAHILFTRNYMTVCEDIAGKYIHHAPTSEEEKARGDGIIPSKRTLLLLKAIFGNVSPLWNRLPKELHEQGNCCSDCGHGGKGGANCCRYACVYSSPLANNRFHDDVQ
jgi:hypothetical protein